MAWGKRFICVIPIATASSFIGIARRNHGREIQMAARHDHDPAGSQGFARGVTPGLATARRSRDNGQDDDRSSSPGLAGDPASNV